MPPSLLGAIIAGGTSRRFGSDKALADLEGQTLLGHVFNRLSLQTAGIVICGREVPGSTCLTDRPEPGLGPLGGISAALHFATVHGFDAILTSACDTPEVPPDLARALVGRSAAIVIGQPLFGYWPIKLAPDLDAYLTAGNSLAVSDWAVWAGARHVRMASAIANINTPGDLTALRIKRFVAA
jgi:molybdopterin-guanine dinucleotide biosynthesis protein A